MTARADVVDTAPLERRSVDGGSQHVDGGSSDRVADDVTLWPVRPGDAVLDVGCGAFDLAPGLRASGGTLVGMTWEPLLVACPQGDYDRLLVTAIEVSDLE